MVANMDINAAIQGPTAPDPISLDIGCGINKKPGYIGVDAIAFPNVDIVHDLRGGPWPFADNSVGVSHCSHFIEHLTNLNDRWERVHFFNELWRITVPGGKCTLTFPYWGSNRFYGDPTHKEPLSEFTFYYLDPNWRATNAPHIDSVHVPHGYRCHWACTWGHNLLPDLNARNDEYKIFAAQFFKDAVTDLVVTMEAIKPSAPA
jgi:SAM-dependent methyltransferase